MPIDKTKITKEMLEKAALCQTSDELIVLAKTEGIEITKAEAEAYLAELQNMELDQETLEKVAGGLKVVTEKKTSVKPILSIY
ncbi:MAG: hypothetical protein IKX02_01295 [Spirochaetales bacterium]|nr:hypothetical protein [Spirochaetales bacterium]